MAEHKNQERERKRRKKEIIIGANTYTTDT